MKQSTAGMESEVTLGWLAIAARALATIVQAQSYELIFFVAAKKICCFCTTTTMTVLKRDYMAQRLSFHYIPLPSSAASLRRSVEIGRGTTTSVEKTDFWKRDSYLSLFSQPERNVECWNNRKNSSTSKETSAFSISVRSQSHMTEISMRSRPIHASWIPVCLRLHKHIFPI